MIWEGFKDVCSDEDLVFFRNGPCSLSHAEKAHLLQDFPMGAQPGSAW